MWPTPGDTGPDAALASLGRYDDLYIVDATDRHQQPDAAPAPPGPWLNPTAGGAAAAAAAGARRLLLTHFWPGNDRGVSRTTAGEVFAGEIILANEGLESVLP